MCQIIVIFIYLFILIAGAYRTLIRKIADMGHQTQNQTSTAVKTYGGGKRGDWRGDDTGRFFVLFCFLGGVVVFLW